MRQVFRDAGRVPPGQGPVGPGRPDYFHAERPGQPGNYQQRGQRGADHRPRVIFGARVPRPGLATVTVYAAPVLLGAIAPDCPLGKLEQVAGDLNRAGIPTRVVPDILTHIWGKVLYNCALNPLGAVLGAPYGALGENRQTRELMRRIIFEIYRVARAKKIPLSPKGAAAYFRHFMAELVPPTAAHFPSMWQDLQAGRRTEIEALNGPICRYGGQTGVPTPYNEAVSRLVRFLEARNAGGNRVA